MATAAILSNAQDLTPSPAKPGQLICAKTSGGKVDCGSLKDKVEVVDTVACFAVTQNTSEPYVFAYCNSKGWHRIHDLGLPLPKNEYGEYDHSSLYEK